MSERVTYTARCERSGKWWAVRVPEVPGVFTQARRLDQVEAVVREALALFLEIPEGEIAVRLEVVLPPEWEHAVAEARQQRRAAEEQQCVARHALNQAVELLVEQGGLPLRDVGRILDLSFQHVADVHRRTHHAA